MVTTGTTTADIDSVIDTRAVGVVFQPILDLRTMQVAGLEAFVRGPAGSDLESPGALFAAAAAVDRVAELDWAARAAAFRAVLDADLPPSLSIFVNTEPESLGTECPVDLRADVGRAEAHLRVFVEVNDRALVADPAGLVAAVDRARSMGWGIAVDDVGSGRAPIVLLPVVHADVVKVDLGLLREASQADASAVLTATLRHVERTGAALCVERIESEDDLWWARALGAVLGQGHHLAPPGPLPETLPAPRLPVPLVASEGDDAVSSPFELLDDLEPRRVEHRDFLDLARTLAFGSIAPGAAPVVLVGLGRSGFDPEVAASFPDGVAPVLYVMFGTGLSVGPVPGLRAVSVDPGDPLAGLEFLVSMNEKGGLALLARALPDGDLELVLTQDRERVHGIARHLVRRVPPPTGDGRALPPPVGDVDEAVIDDAPDGARPDGPRPDAGVEHARRGVFGRRR